MVVLREDLVDCEEYSGVMYADFMSRHGHILKIASAYEDEFEGNFYNIIEDGGDYLYGEDMFAGLLNTEENEKPTLTKKQIEDILGYEINILV